MAKSNRIKPAVRWSIAAAVVVLLTAGALVLRPALRPCGWLDVALNRSGCLYTLSQSEAAVADVAFSPDGQLLAISSRDGVVQLWRVSSRTLLRTYEPAGSFEGEAYTYHIAFSPDGSTLAQGLPSGQVLIWDADPGHVHEALVDTLEQTSTKMGGLTYSPDGRTLIVGTGAGPILVWDVSQPSTPRRLVGHTNQVVSVAHAPGEDVIASASLDGTVRLWDLPSGTVIEALERRPVTTGVAFSPDGRVLATDHHLWNVDTWTLAETMEPVRGGLGNVAFSPDGELLAAGNASYEIRWWRAADGTLLRAVKGHSDSVNSVAFSPDGDILASGSLDGTVRLWRVPEAE